jgi:hypothetical protein
LLYEVDPAVRLRVIRLPPLPLIRSPSGPPYETLAPWGNQSHCSILVQADVNSACRFFASALCVIAKIARI